MKLKNIANAFERKTGSPLVYPQLVSEAVDYLVGNFLIDGWANRPTIPPRIFYAMDKFARGEASRNDRMEVLLHIIAQETGASRTDITNTLSEKFENIDEDIVQLFTDAIAEISQDYKSGDITPEKALSLAQGYKHIDTTSTAIEKYYFDTLTDYFETVTGEDVTDLNATIASEFGIAPQSPIAEAIGDGVGIKAVFTGTGTPDQDRSKYKLIIPATVLNDIIIRFFQSPGVYELESTPTADSSALGNLLNVIRKKVRSQGSDIVKDDEKTSVIRGISEWPADINDAATVRASDIPAFFSSLERFLRGHNAEDVITTSLDNQRDTDTERALAVRKDFQKNVLQTQKEQQAAELDNATQLALEKLNELLAKEEQRSAAEKGGTTMRAIKSTHLNPFAEYDKGGTWKLSDDKRTLFRKKRSKVDIDAAVRRGGAWEYNVGDEILCDLDNMEYTRGTIQACLPELHYEILTSAGRRITIDESTIIDSLDLF